MISPWTSVFLGMSKNGEVIGLEKKCGHEYELDMGLHGVIGFILS